MFIITQTLSNCIKEDLSLLDILTDPNGQVMTFDSKGEAMRFLNSLGYDNTWNEDYVEQGGIQVDRLH
jgi:hypothetical protein|tara:strand:+ start:67 stop:270 length:204 start_codon:yes stop_codon:yes gene_type:complete